MSEDKVYKDGDIVWVKLGNNWWPGEVTGDNRHPDGLVRHLKRLPYCVVKFFNEDAFEYVRSAKQIFPFQCAKKEEFLRKGYSLYKSGNSFMEKFPEDVKVAERLIHRKESALIVNDRSDSIVKAILGQPLIHTSLDDAEYREQRRRGDSTTTIINITTNRNASTPVKPTAPISNSKGIDASLLAKNVVASASATTTSAATSAAASKATSPGNSNYQCNLCDFTSVRQNVMILHRKIHSNRNVGTTAPAVKTTAAGTTRTVEKTTTAAANTTEEATTIVAAATTTATAATTAAVASAIATNHQDHTNTKTDEESNKSNNVIKTKGNISSSTTKLTSPTRTRATRKTPLGKSPPVKEETANVIPSVVVAPIVDEPVTPIRTTRSSRTSALLAASPKLPTPPKAVAKKKKEPNALSAYFMILSDFSLSESDTSPSSEDRKTSRRSLRHSKTPPTTSTTSIPNGSDNVSTTASIDLPETPKPIKKIPKKRGFINLPFHEEEGGKGEQTTPEFDRNFTENLQVSVSTPKDSPPKENVEEIRKMLLADWSDEDETPTEQQNEIVNVLDNSLIIVENQEKSENKIVNDICSTSSTPLTSSTPTPSIQSTTARIRNIPKKDRRDIVLQDFQSDLSLIQTDNEPAAENYEVVMHVDSSNSSVAEIVEDEQPTASVIIINDDEEGGGGESVVKDSDTATNVVAELKMSKDSAIDSALGMNDKSASAATSTTTLSCFDFQDEEEDQELATTTISHFKKKYLSVEKLQNLSLSITETEEDKSANKLQQELAEKDQQLAQEIESLLQLTQPPVSDLLNVNSLEETISVKDLPIKERGKRIFKSRNKSRMEEKTTTTTVVELPNKSAIEDNVKEQIEANESLTQETEEKKTLSETPKDLKLPVQSDESPNKEDLESNSPRKNQIDITESDATEAKIIENVSNLTDKHRTQEFEGETSKRSLIEIPESEMLQSIEASNLTQEFEVVTPKSNFIEISESEQIQSTEALNLTQEYEGTIGRKSSFENSESDILQSAAMETPSSCQNDEHLTQNDNNENEDQTKQDLPDITSNSEPKLQKDLHVGQENDDNVSVDSARESSSITPVTMETTIEEIEKESIEASNESEDLSNESEKVKEIENSERNEISGINLSKKEVIDQIPATSEEPVVESKEVIIDQIPETSQEPVIDSDELVQMSNDSDAIKESQDLREHSNEETLKLNENSQELTDNSVAKEHDDGAVISKSTENLIHHSNNEQEKEDQEGLKSSEDTSIDVTQMENPIDNNFENNSSEDKQGPEPISQSNIEVEEDITAKANVKDIMSPTEIYDDNANIDEENKVLNDINTVEEEKQENFYKIRVKSQAELLNKEFIETSEMENELVTTNEEISAYARLSSITPTDENSSMCASDTGAEFGSPTSMLSEERLPTFRFNSYQTPNDEPETVIENIMEREIQKQRDQQRERDEADEESSNSKESAQDEESPIESIASPKDTIDSDTLKQEEFSTTKLLLSVEVGTIESKTPSEDSSKQQIQGTANESLRNKNEVARTPLEEDSQESNENSKETTDSKLFSPSSLLKSSSEEKNRPKSRHMKITPRRNVKELFKADKIEKSGSISSIKTLDTDSQDSDKPQDIGEVEIESPEMEQLTPTKETSNGGLSMQKKEQLVNEQQADQKFESSSSVEKEISTEDNLMQTTNIQANEASKDNDDFVNETYVTETISHINVNNEEQKEDTNVSETIAGTNVNKDEQRQDSNVTKTICDTSVNKDQQKEDLIDQNLEENLLKTDEEKITESSDVISTQIKENAINTIDDASTKESEIIENTQLEGKPQETTISKEQSYETNLSEGYQSLQETIGEITLTLKVPVLNQDNQVVDNFLKQPKQLSPSNQKKRSGEIVLLIEPKQRKCNENNSSTSQAKEETETQDKLLNKKKSNDSPPTKDHHDTIESNVETVIREMVNTFSAEKSEKPSPQSNPPIITVIHVDDVDYCIPKQNITPPISDQNNKTISEHLGETPFSPGIPPATPQESEVVIECESFNQMPATPQLKEHVIECETTHATATTPQTPHQHNLIECETLQPLSTTPQTKDLMVECETINPPTTPTTQAVAECEVVTTPATPQTKDIIIECEPSTPQGIIECDHSLPTQITPEKEIVVESDIIIPMPPATTAAQNQDLIIETDENLHLDEKESLIEREFQVLPSSEDGSSLANVPQQVSNSLQTDADKAAEEFLIEFDSIVNHSHSVEEDIHQSMIDDEDGIVQEQDDEDVINPEDLINNIIEEVHDEIPKQDCVTPTLSHGDHHEHHEPLTTFALVSSDKDSRLTTTAAASAVKRRQTICFEISNTSDIAAAASSGLAYKKQALDFESMLPVTKTIKRTAERKLTLPAIETKLSGQPNQFAPAAAPGNNHNQVTLNKKLFPTTKRKLSIEDNITSFIIERPKQQQTNTEQTSAGPPPLQRIRSQSQYTPTTKLSMDNIGETSSMLNSNDHLFQDLYQTTSSSSSPTMETAKNHLSEGGRVIHQQILSGPVIASITTRRASDTTKFSRNKQIGIDSRGNKYVIIKTPPTDIIVQPPLAGQQQQQALITVPQVAAAQTATVSTATSTNFGNATTLTIQPISAATKSKLASNAATKTKLASSSSSAARKQQQQQQQISITVPAAAATTTTSSKMEIKPVVKKRKTQTRTVATTTPPPPNSNTNSAKHKQAMEALSRRLSIAAETPPLTKIPRTSTHAVQTQISANTSNLSQFFGDTQISSIAQQQLMQLQHQQQQQQQLAQQPLPPPIILNKNAHQQSVIQRKSRKTPQQQQQLLLQQQHQQAQAKSAQLLQQLQIQQQNLLQQQQQLQQQQLQQQFIAQIATQQQQLQQQNALLPPPLQQMQQQQQSQQIVQQNHQNEGGVIITTAAAAATTEDDDVIDSNTQLIALPTTPYPGYSETFLLCKVKGNTCKPVDNVPLYLNHQLNELVPVPLEAIEGGGHKLQDHQIEIKSNNTQLQQQHHHLMASSNDNKSHITENEMSAGHDAGGGDTGLHHHHHHQQQQQHHHQQHQQLMEDNSAGDNQSGSNETSNQINNYTGNQNNVQNDLVTNNGILLNIEGQQVLLDAATFAHLLANPDANTQLISDDGTEYVLTHEVLTALQMQQEQQQALELANAAAAAAVEQQQQQHHHHQQHQHQQHHHQLSQQTGANDILAVALAGTDIVYGNDVLTIDTSQSMQLIDTDGSIVFQPTQTGGGSSLQQQQHLTPPAVVTNAVLDQSPIMSALEVPSSVGHKLQGSQMITVPASHHLATSTALGLNGPSNLEDSLAAIGVTTQSSTSLGLPITVTNPNIASKVTSVTAGPLSEMLQFVSHRPATAAATAAAVAAAAMAGESRIFND